MSEVKVINTNRVLITFKASYGDDLTVEGFATDGEERWNEHMAEVEALFGTPEDVLVCYFGTNESITIIFEDFDEYKGSFTVKPITHDEEDTIKKLFGTKGFGHFMMISQ